MIAQLSDFVNTDAGYDFNIVHLDLNILLYYNLNVRNIKGGKTKCLKTAL